MKKIWIKLGWIALAAALLVNVMAYVHAYHFTHFSRTAQPRTADPTQLTLTERAKTVLLGISNPRPRHQAAPAVPYETHRVHSSFPLEAWKMPTAAARGTCIIFHGYAADKSAMLGRAEVLQQLGYEVWLVDFAGSGGSGGAITSVGYHEADQVRDVYRYVQAQGDTAIHLMGVSMGAAAILKALHDDHTLQPASVVLECSFGSLYEAVSNRFELMKLPSFPMAGLLTFWGGVQHGYWAFGHQPARYAQDVAVPTLVLYGAEDDRVTLQETTAIFDHLAGPKELKIYPRAGHDLFVPENQSLWKDDVQRFLQRYP